MLPVRLRITSLLVLLRYFFPLIDQNPLSLAHPAIPGRWGPAITGAIAWARVSGMNCCPSLVSHFPRPQSKPVPGTRVQFFWLSFYSLIHQGRLCSILIFAWWRLEGSLHFWVTLAFSVLWRYLVERISTPSAYRQQSQTFPHVVWWKLHSNWAAEESGPFKC